VTARLTGEQRAWCLYDWANSVIKTSVIAVFFSLTFTQVVEADARASGQPCVTSLQGCAVDLLGFWVQAGSMFGFVLAIATVAQLLVLPVIGAIADQIRAKRALLVVFALAGSVATCTLATLRGTSWRFAAVMFGVMLLCYYSSIVVYYALLPEVADADQRDTVSAKGWAVGYLSGGLCLALNIVLIRVHDRLALSESDAIRLCFVMCGLWWAVFTLVAVRGLTDRPPDHARENARESRSGLLGAGFRQLASTLGQARKLPITLAFLGAYLIFIEGVNTTVATASLYGSQELRLPVDVVTTTVLVVQFVAFAGGLAHGRLADRIGAKRTILVSLTLWTLLVTSAYFIETGNRGQFYALAVGIGLVLGGTPALSRSLFSQLVPRGREAEYFALYTLGERGTSSLGPLLFSVVATTTGSFRPAVLSLVAFLVIGMALTWFVPVRQGIRAAGNPEPRLT
jgi:UMF1 family MFS transporter